MPRIALVVALTVMLFSPLSYGGEAVSKDALAKTLLSKEAYNFVASQEIAAGVERAFKEIKQQGNGFSAEEEPFKRKAAQRMVKQLFDRDMSYDHFISYPSKVMNKRLTASEMSEAVAFYKSSCGKKILAWGYDVGRESLKKTTASLQGPQNTEAVIAAFKQEMMNGLVQNFSTLLTTLDQEEMMSYFAFATSPAGQKLTDLMMNDTTPILTSIKDDFEASIDGLKLEEEFQIAEEAVLAEQMEKKAR